MHKRMRNAMLGLLGAGALVGLTPGVASAAITQQTLGAQNCTYYYNNIVTGGTYSGYARLQLVRWDNGTSTTRAYQLNVIDESGDQITKIQTQAVDATTGAAVGSVWTLTKNSGSFYIRDNLGSNGNGAYWKFATASHHYYLWIWFDTNVLRSSGGTCSMKYYYF